jgi:hypothetical protein
MYRTVCVGLMAAWLSGPVSAWAQDCGPLKPSMAIDTEIRNVTEANANVLLKSLGSGEIKNDYQRIQKNQQFTNPDDTNRWDSFIYLLCSLLKDSSLSDDRKIAQYFKLLELSRQSPPNKGESDHATPGDVLYDSETSKDGFETWSLTPDWKHLNDTLANDGTGPYPRFAAIFASYDPQSADYILEAEIRVIRHKYSASFGLIARAHDKGGYAVGLDAFSSAVNICYLNEHWQPKNSIDCLEEGPKLNPGTDWHRYDVAVNGNTITLLVDGAMATTATDNRFLSPGRVGLWSSGYQLEVRKFKVIKP